MRVSIRYAGIERQERLLEQESRELSALEAELKRLRRLVLSQPGGDDSAVRKSLEQVRKLHESVRRRQAFLVWLVERFRQAQSTAGNNTAEMASLLRDTGTES